MKPYQHFYDLKSGGLIGGFFQINFDGQEIVSKFSWQQKDLKIENEFRMTYENKKMITFKFNQGLWQKIKFSHKNPLPASAFPHLLYLVKDVYEYLAIDEETGAEIGSTNLVRQGDLIFERRSGQTVRTFQMKDDIPIEFNFGNGIQGVLSEKKEIPRDFDYR